MKKLKKIVLVLLVMSLLINPMYLTLRVHAANEELATSRISDTLRSVMKNSAEEKIQIIIWLNDINASAEKLTSTKAILAQAKAISAPRGLCEASTTDAAIYSQYMAERKEVLKEYYQEYTQNFSNSYLNENEVLYSSKYVAAIIAELTRSRINDIAALPVVSSIDYYNDTIQESGSVNSNARYEIIGDDLYNTVAEIMHGYGIDDLLEHIDTQGEGVSIGILDKETPDLSHPMFGNNITLHYADPLGMHLNTHPTHIFEILYSILPDADYYYTTYWNTEDIAGVRTNLANEIEWLLDNNVDVISCSQHLYSHPNKYADYDDNYNDYGSIARYLDEIITNYGVIFVTSAGNQPHAGIASGGMSYNAITVGNYNIRQNTISEYSAYYTGSDWAYKPDICAPGYYSFVTTELEDCGTSYATPIVAAMAALILIDSNYMLLSYDVKSIICAGASRMLYSINDPNYRIYGAGVIDGSYVASILQNNTYNYNYLSPNEDEHSYTIYLDGWTIPSFALSFEYSDTGSNNYVIGDLDLFLYDPNGNLVASSQTTQNNVELIRFEEDYSGWYTLVVEQVTPPEEGGTDTYVFYSVAWYISEYD